jgi:4-hydroxyphenylpyruvate dioxygenase
MQLIAPLPKSIATVSLSGTLAEKREAAAAIGFDGVENFENDLLTFEGSPRTSAISPTASA